MRKQTTFHFAPFRSVKLVRVRPLVFRSAWHRPCLPTRPIALLRTCMAPTRTERYSVPLSVSACFTDEGVVDSSDSTPTTVDGLVSQTVSKDDLQPTILHASSPSNTTVRLKSECNFDATSSIATSAEDLIANISPNPYAHTSRTPVLHAASNSVFGGHALQSLSVDTRYGEPTQVVALDCEMVWISAKGKKKALARATIVNIRGEVVYDKFARVDIPIVDYRTQYSGITAETLVDAAPFDDVQRQVERLLRGRVVVGHGLKHDFKALKLSHPSTHLRDTAKYFSTNQSPKLSTLVAQHLDDLEFQKGAHDSAQDARAALALYMKHRKQWETQLRSDKAKKTSTGIAKESKPNQGIE